VKGLRTRWGTLSYSMRRDRKHVFVNIERSDLRLPSGGLRIAEPEQAEVPEARYPGGRVKSLPAHIRYTRQYPNVHVFYRH
jgi:hypothetical protein